ncbi:MAG: MATE family efflux transporter [Polyangiaceae bacterium]
MGSVGLSMPERSPSQQKALHREVWALAWPAITHMLLVTLVFLIDRLVLGHHDNSELASIQISGVLVWTLYAIFTAGSAGTVAIVARTLGAGDAAAAGRASVVSLGFAALSGIAVTAIVLASMGPLLPLVFPGASANVLDKAQQYLMIVLPFLPAAFLEASAAASLQAAGDTRTPFLAGLVANAVNLVLSAGLVFGVGGLPALGIRGAAIGAASAMLIQGAMLVYALARRCDVLPFAGVVADLRVRETLRRLLRVSAPSYLEKLVYNGGYVLFVVVIARLGDAAMAANQAMVSIEAVCFLSADGFGIAAGALVARKLGAGEKDDARAVAAIATRMAIGLLGACAVVFACAPRLLLRAFTDDEAIVDMGARALPVMAIAQPFMAYATVIRMSLRGAGATSTVLWVTLVGTFCIRLPLAYLLVSRLGWGLTGIWLASTADWAAQSAIVFRVFQRGRWRDRQV